MSATAWGATFYVNQHGKSSTCSGPGSNACKTIQQAITQAQGFPPPNTIEVAGEESDSTFKESIELESTRDTELTIKGETPGIVFEGGASPGLKAQFPGSVTLSNVKLKASETAVLTSAAVVVGTAVTLDDVAVENERSGGINGIELREKGALTMKGGSVEMEDGSTGFAVDARESAVALDGVTIVDSNASEAQAGGIFSEKAPLALADSTVAINAGTGENQFALITEADLSVSIENVRVVQNTGDNAVLLESSPTKATGLKIEMLDSSSHAAGLITETASPETPADLSHLEIGGTWLGPVALDGEGQVTISDGRLSENPLSTVPALLATANGVGKGLLLQRSVLQASAAAPEALKVVAANATTDSSEILGGKTGVLLENGQAATDTVTLSASTIDPGASGIADDAAGTTGVQAIAKDGPGAVANVAIEGSIVLGADTAAESAGNTAAINCSYSAAPSQSQTAAGGSGAIGCAAGTSGNSEINPLSALFAEPLSAYQLNPSSAAVDSIPAGAIALPFGFTPSSTDLAGNPRVVDGNGDCMALQDKGALELQGHSAPCPTPVVVAKAVAASISGLTISPSAFLAAPSGPTASAARHRKYGAKVSYRDSQSATTTFTVLRESAGRRQGRACRRPSKKNRHARRCTILTRVGSFTHTDRAGLNSFHFSGRIRGHRLAPGVYELEAVARDAAGNGRAAIRAFTIR
jgi:hypothetical protein